MGDPIDRAVAASEAFIEVATLRVDLPDAGRQTGRFAELLLPVTLTAVDVIVIEDYLHQALARIDQDRRTRSGIILPA